MLGILNTVCFQQESCLYLDFFFCSIKTGYLKLNAINIKTGILRKAYSQFKICSSVQL